MNNFYHNENFICVNDMFYKRIFYKTLCALVNIQALCMLFQNYNVQI